MEKEIKKKFWTSLSSLAEEYKDICEKEEEFAPFLHKFDKCGINILVFKSESYECDAIVEYLSIRIMEGDHVLP